MLPILFAPLLVASLVAININLISTSKLDESVKFVVIESDSNHVQFSNGLTSLHILTSDLDHNLALKVHGGAVCRIYSQDTNTLSFESDYEDTFDYPFLDFYIVAKLPSNISNQSTGQWPARYEKVWEWATSMSNISITFDYFAVFHVVRSLSRNRSSSLGWSQKNKSNPGWRRPHTFRRVNTNSNAAVKKDKTPPAPISESERKMRTCRKRKTRPVENNENNPSKCQIKEDTSHSLNEFVHCTESYSDSDEVIQILMAMKTEK